jgi:hypothetical protein
LKANCPPAAQHLAQRTIDGVALLLLAAENSDALAVFTQARERVTIFGFRLVLFSDTRTKRRPMSTIDPLASTA